MRTFALLSFTILLLGCNTVSPEEPSTPTEVAETEEERYYYWPSQGQAQIIYQVEQESDEAYHLQYPVITNLEVSHPVAQAVNQTLQRNLETFKTEASTFFDDSEAGFEAGTAIPWDYSIEWLGGRYDRLLWSLALQVYTYHGGAHGNSYTQTFNYAPRENQLLNIADFFIDETYQPAVLEKIKSELVMAKTKRWQTSGQTEPYQAELDETLNNLTFSTELTNAWVISQQSGELGFLFFFAPYEVGAYSEGAYEVFVPISVFSDYLKDEFRGVFE